MRAAYVSLSDPFGRSHGGTVRQRAVISGLRSSGVEVTCFYPLVERDVQIKSQGRIVDWLYSTKRRFLPMPTQAAGRDSELRRRLAEGGQFDLAVVSVLSQINIAKSCGAPVWFDALDLWSEFALTESKARRGLSRLTARVQSAGLARFERRVFDTAAVVTAAGWTDYQKIRESQGVRARYLPVALPDGSFDEPPPKSDAQNYVGFLANFDFWPNADAYHYLVEKWLTPLSDLGYGVRVAGYGSESLKRFSGIEYLGVVDSVDEFYASVSATIAPIRLGGGVKVKILESLAKNRPVIATSHATAGLPPDLQSQVSVVDNPSCNLTRSMIEGTLRKSTSLDCLRLTESDRVIHEIVEEFFSQNRTCK